MKSSNYTVVAVGRRDSSHRSLGCVPDLRLKMLRIAGDYDARAQTEAMPRSPDGE
jgi:hypothetical protein